MYHVSLPLKQPEYFNPLTQDYKMTDDENKEKYSDATQKNAFSIFLMFTIFLTLFFAIWDAITQRYKSWPTWSYALCSTTLTSVLLWIVFAAKKSINPQTLSLYIKKHLNRLPLFAAICLWVTAAVILYTALNWMWGKNGVLSGWTLNGETSGPLERIKSSLVIIGGIGGVGYLVIKYREQSGAERDRARLEENEADKKLADAVQQLGSESPQVRIAGIYALADVADTYGSKKYGVDYNKRVVEILCGYLRTVRSENDRPIESAIFSTLSNHLTPPANSLHDKSIGPWSRYTIDLRGAILRETINFQGACIASLDCRQAEFYGKADFTEAHFDGDTRLDNAHFHRTAIFTGTQFQQDTRSTESGAAFVGTRFDGNTYFDNAHFHNKSIFNNAHFHHKADFTGTQFQQDTRSTESGAAFVGTRFDGNTYFDNAHFHNKADFTGAQFQDNAKTNLNTSFAGTHFHNKSIFNNAHFHQNAESTLTGLKVTFERCHFEGETFFYNTHFWGKAIFDSDRNEGEKTIFEKDAYFHGTRFWIASFQGAIFKSYAGFGREYGNSKANFEGNVIFRYAKFKRADFSGVKFKGVNFSHATFREVNFGGVTFGLPPLGNLSADFDNAVFKERVNFQDHLYAQWTIFEGDVRFRRAQLPRFSSFGIDETFEMDLRLSDKFSATIFKQGADFCGINCESISFRGVQFNRKLQDTQRILFPESIRLGQNGLPLGATWIIFHSIPHRPQTDINSFRG